MIVTTKLTISMITGEVLVHEWFEYNGPVALCCGATDQQKQIGAAQQSWMNTAMNQAQQVFGNSSQVFNDLISTFAPTVANGPNQEGFSAPEKAALNSQAITETGNAYRDASTAVKEANAAVGGGNIALPGGADIGRNLSVAESAARQKSSELNQIEQADYATGRQNYDKAVSGLAEAPNVFNPATSATGAATTSGEAAANTADQIAKENNSWVSAVTGALGGIAGDVATGGMKNLGEGVGFFGQNA